MAKLYDWGATQLGCIQIVNQLSIDLKFISDSTLIIFFLSDNGVDHSFPQHIWLYLL